MGIDPEGPKSSIGATTSIGAADPAMSIQEALAVLVGCLLEHVPKAVDTFEDPGEVMPGLVGLEVAGRRSLAQLQRT